MTAPVVAAVDCGTNSIRLLIARAGEGGGLVELARELEIVRLGQGIDATGELHPDALRRTFGAVEAYAARIRSAGVDRVRFVATSAARDARNREAFFAGIEERIGVVPEVISGTEEAELSFAGAAMGLSEVEEPVLVMDIGGGSTELIVGGRSGITAAESVDLGSVRITERCWPGATDPQADPAPPTGRQVALATDAIERVLDAVDVPFAAVRTWVGVAGTVTSMAAIAQDLPHYDRGRVHGYRLAVDELRALALHLRTTPVAALRAIGSLHPQRADVIGAGALIADRVSHRITVSELIVSESDILDGIARRLLAEVTRDR